MKTKNFKYEKGGAGASMSRYKKPKKYQTAGVYGQSQLNLNPNNAGTQQFRYTSQDPNAMALAQQGADQAGQDYDQGIQEHDMQMELDAKKSQMANTAVGTGLTLANKGNMTANFAAQKAFKQQVSDQMATGMSKKMATDAVLQSGATKPMAQGLLGTGTATVGMSNAINVGSLIGSVGGNYLEGAWSDDDATTYTTKEGIAGAIKTGSTWAGYGNMILPGVGGLVGGVAGVVSSIFTGKSKARKAKKERKRLEREFKDRQGQFTQRIGQLRSQGQQQVGAMMGNKLGGPRQYAHGGRRLYGNGGPPMVYGKGGMQMVYGDGGPPIDPPPMEQDTTRVELTAQQEYQRWLEMQRQLEMQKYMESTMRQTADNERLMPMPMPPPAAADNTYVPPSAEELMELQKLYQMQKTTGQSGKMQLGGIQAIPEEQMVTMQQYQQPMQGMQPMNTMPFLRGGFKRY